MRRHVPVAMSATMLLVLAGSQAAAQNRHIGSQSLLPMPSMTGVVQTASPPVRYAYRQAPNDEPGSPSDYNAPPEEVAPQIGNGNLHGGRDPYQAAMSDNWGNSGACGRGCGVGGGGCCGPVWFGGVYGLLMTKDDENPLWLSYDDAGTGGTGRSVMTSRDADMNYEGGTEIRFGRTFCDGCHAWEVVYWGIFQEGEQADQLGAWYIGNLNTPLTFDNLDLGGDNVLDWYNNSRIHRLRRNYEFHNVEINLLRFQYGNSCLLGANYGGGCSNCGGCCSRFSAAGLFGIRYLKTDEDFWFSTDDADTTFGNSPTNELHYHVDVENHLIGAQLGCLACYQATCRANLFTDFKFGLYGNHITHSQALNDGAGTFATINNGAWTGEEFNFRSSKNDVAFLGELRVGVNYQINCRWRATAAYRAVALTGVALPTNQVPHDFADFNDILNIDSNGSMILHGFQFGVETRF